MEIVSTAVSGISQVSRRYRHQCAEQASAPALVLAGGGPREGSSDNSRVSYPGSPDPYCISYQVGLGTFLGAASEYKPPLYIRVRRPGSRSAAVPRYLRFPAYLPDCFRYGVSFLVCTSKRCQVLRTCWLSQHPVLTLSCSWRRRWKPNGQHFEFGQSNQSFAPRWICSGSRLHRKFEY